MCFVHIRRSVIVYSVVPYVPFTAGACTLALLCRSFRHAVTWSRPLAPPPGSVDTSVDRHRSEGPLVWPDDVGKRRRLCLRNLEGKERSKRHQKCDTVSDASRRCPTVYYLLLVFTSFVVLIQATCLLQERVVA